MSHPVNALIKSCVLHAFFSISLHGRTLSDLSDITLSEYQKN